MLKKGTKVKIISCHKRFSHNLEMGSTATIIQVDKDANAYFVDGISTHTKAELSQWMDGSDIEKII